VWRYTPFFRKSFTSESTFLFAQFWLRYLPPIFWERCAWLALPYGGDTPAFASPVNGRHPPPVFRLGFTLETELMSSPGKGIGRGEPHCANCPRPPPPCFSKGRGVPLWVGMGGEARRFPVFVRIGRFQLIAEANGYIKSVFSPSSRNPCLGETRQCATPIPSSRWWKPARISLFKLGHN